MPHLVANKEEALEKVKSLIPAGASVTTGASVTLEQIGFVDLLKSGDHPWKNLKVDIVAEKDPIKQALLRKQSVLADYFLASVHALAETGEVVIASATGSQLPSDAFTSDNVIWVVGAQKIVPTLEDGLKRLREYVFPLENEHMKTLYGVGSVLAKILIFEREAPSSKRNIHLILVKEVLGF
jgi:L-lactate utilization protein LutC